jgi:hypothetical protein
MGGRRLEEARHLVRGDDAAPRGAEAAGREAAVEAAAAARQVRAKEGEARDTQP